jgi:hypothetical protein
MGSVPTPFGVRITRVAVKDPEARSYCLSMTSMKIQTREGFKVVRTHNLVSTNAKEVVAFLKKSGLTGGFSVNFAVNPETREVVEVFKKGHPAQRDIKPLIEQGFTEFLFSWAFSGKTFEVDGVEVLLSRTIDLVAQKDVEPYRGLVG